MLCQCGCGQDAGEYPSTQDGHRKGDPRPYVRGHWMHKRKLTGDPPNPSGLCMCGCGKTTTIARQGDRKSGDIRGEHKRYWGHHGALSTRRESITPDMWIEEDRGYESPCWIGTSRSMNQFGHQKTSINGKVIGIHRAMYEQTRGPIPEGLELDHLCKQPSCCRPDHLEAVTHAENIRRSPLAKLTSADAVAIRASNERAVVLAERYEISVKTIYDIKSRKSWADV